MDDFKLSDAYSTLEETCPVCNGALQFKRKGGFELNGEEYEYWYCRNCAGQGKIPNWRGQRLLEFLQRHLTSPNGGSLRPRVDPKKVVTQYGAQQARHNKVEISSEERAS